MPFISGFDRNQSLFLSLDDFIDENNQVRLIDHYVNLLDLDSLGFITFSPSNRGQQPYNRSDLLKLHIYGYINGVRSSRKLEKLTHINLEVMWLINNALPRHSCISDFIKDNKSAVENTFKDFVKFLKFAGFVSAKNTVIDGSKFRAQNSRNKYFSIKKIDATIDFFNSQIENYTLALKSTTSNVFLEDDPNAVISISNKISNYRSKLAQYNSLKKNMIDNNLSQITLTDPDSRMMSSHGNSNISYNLQTSVDSENSLIVAFDVVNDINDSNQLENMVTKTTDNLGTIPTSSIADMGYFNAQQIFNCENLGTNVYIKRPKSKNSTNNSSFSIDKFKFIPDKNIYICPYNKQLTFSRELKKRKNKVDKHTSIIGYEYSCSECHNCPYFGKCTTSSSGRRITRNFFQDTLDMVQKRMEQHPEMYTLRKCVVEHPFRYY